MAMSRSYYASPYYGNSKGGKRWEDGTFTSVKKITMTANDMTLTSAQLHYGLAGHDPSVRWKSFGGVVHGGGDKTATTTKEFVLSPHECLTKMTGYKGMYRDEWNNEWCVIKSLTFYTDKGRTFSCGPKVGDYFETTVDGEIVGFFGSASDSLLDSIGVYMLLDR
uniref:Jacalin-type lectin domain-containing protein n=1 Tax=Picea sitchensis TaxID=3332 RepID=A9NLT2_PICSI|nr:unknown [Picea sitchensis]ABK24772.1 unknown [Picea sitchensis]